MEPRVRDKGGKFGYRLLSFTPFEEVRLDVLLGGGRRCVLWRGRESERVPRSIKRAGSLIVFHFHWVLMEPSLAATPSTLSRANGSRVNNIKHPLAAVVVGISLSMTGFMRWSSAEIGEIDVMNVLFGWFEINTILTAPGGSFVGKRSFIF